MKYFHRLPIPGGNRSRYRAIKWRHRIESVAHWELRQAEPMMCYCFVRPFSVPLHDDQVDATLYLASALDNHS